MKTLATYRKGAREQAGRSSLAPSHGHQQADDGQAKANAIIPSAEVRHERDVLASEVIDHKPQQEALGYQQLWLRQKCSGVEIPQADLNVLILTHGIAWIHRGPANLIVIHQCAGRHGLTRH